MNAPNFPDIISGLLSNPEMLTKIINTVSGLSSFLPLMKSLGGNDNSDTHVQNKQGTEVFSDSHLNSGTTEESSQKINDGPPPFNISSILSSPVFSSLLTSFLSSKASTDNTPAPTTEKSTQNKDTDNAYREVIIDKTAFKDDSTASDMGNNEKNTSKASDEQIDNLSSMLPVFGELFKSSSDSSSSQNEQGKERERENERERTSESRASRDRTALLYALRPYLGEKRREKMDFILKVMGILNAVSTLNNGKK